MTSNSSSDSFTEVPSWDTITQLFDIIAPPSKSDHTTKTPSTGDSGSVASSDITIDSDRNLWFRLYVPAATTTNSTSSTLPVMVYYHGGGFAYWSPDRKPYDDLCRRLAIELSVVVVSVNYRLSPQYRCPTQYEDGFEALKFLDEKKQGDDGILFPKTADLGKCFLAGDSAGANLAHHVAVQASQHKFKALKVRGLITVQPFFSMEERSKSEIRMENDPILPTDRTDMFWNLFLPQGSNRDHPSANVFGPNAKDISRLDNFPPVLIAIGGLDPLQDWDRKYYEWLIGSGKQVKLIEYPNAPHLFYAFPKVVESGMFIAEMKGFLEASLSL